jgi:galactose oxidase
MTVTNTDYDMFCPDDFNGRIAVNGGDTAARTSIYVVSGKDWIYARNMTIHRGYQSSVTVSNGRIFTTGSSWSGGYGGKNGEIYDPIKNY